MSRLRLYFFVSLLMSPGTCLHAQSISNWIDQNCADCGARMAVQTGVYVLEKGEEALIGRAWLAQHAAKSIDVQYFIWSTDNIGILAAEQLLSAAERGVIVRVLVDDFLIDAEDKTLLLLSAHPNVQIRIYNPNVSVGVGFWQRLKNAVTEFRAVNQRMHDKTAIFDDIAGITGGRNMADEYFDYDHEYNFRDRDVLLLGRAVMDMRKNFQEFWDSELSVPVEKIFDDESALVSPADMRRRSALLHSYAADPTNFEPQVRHAIDRASDYFPELLQTMSWEDVVFLSDVPGKNSGEFGLGGGGESTNQLIKAVKSARESILIQSPYLIMPEGGIELFEELVNRGVRIRISTNSLASTDNIQAFSGYQGQRKDLLRAGVELYEFMDEPSIRTELIDRYPRIAENDPVFALHAKSMVIDDEKVFIGTFNLDPRSANLNTEVGMFVESRGLAQQVSDSIERDMMPGNSWQTTMDFNPDFVVSRGKRFKSWFNRMLPIEPVL
ncbi:MAG: phospholipase D family protein [Gammaproteobacteria bacterium]|nr:phospholipase D family protein [Gammaproteobacteria bacterium]